MVTLIGILIGLILIAFFLIGWNLPNIVAKSERKQRIKRQAAEIKRLDAVKAAEDALKFPETTLAINHFPIARDLYLRLRDLFNETSDESVKDAAKLVYNNQLAPAVEWAMKDDSQFKEHMNLIEPLVHNLEIGVKNKQTVELNTFTAYLKAVNEGVVKIPSELDLSGIDFSKIQAAYTPKAISATPALSKEEADEIAMYEDLIRNAQDYARSVTKHGYPNLVPEQERAIASYRQKIQAIQKN